MSMSETPRLQLLKSAYRWYYFNRSSVIEEPFEISKREFGFKDFSGSMIRHMQFRNRGELLAYIIRNVPRSIYSSVAYYKDPTAPMDIKGWEGSDLVFDLDMKDVSEAARENTFWVCGICGEIGAGKGPPACPKCGSQSIIETEWVCDKCMADVKAATALLVSVLTERFGFSNRDITVYFSGDHGFHVHVNSREIITLSQRERAEIIDYLTLNGYDSKRFEANTPNTSLLYDRAVERVAIDPNVTMDIKRVFRLPGSLHDESGITKCRCDDVQECDPLTSCVMLPDEPTKVRVIYAPRFYIKGTWYGPFKQEDVTLPLSAAVYLLAKGLADPLK